MPESPAGAPTLLKRPVAILRTLATAGARGMALTGIARATGLAASTTHRQLVQLIDERLVTRLEGTRRYAIGPLVYELGLAAAQQFDIRGLCHPILEQLAAQVHGTVYLIVRSGDEAVCIDVVEGAAPVRVRTLQLGSRRPLGLGAGGLAILSALPPQDEARLLPRVAGRIEREWQFPEPLLRESLQRARESGFGVIQNRITPGVTAIGRAFRDSLGQVMGAVTVAGTNDRIDEPRQLALRRQLEKASRDIGERLRGHQWARYDDR